MTAMRMTLPDDLPVTERRKVHAVARRLVARVCCPRIHRVAQTERERLGGTLDMIAAFGRHKLIFPMLKMALEELLGGHLVTPLRDRLTREEIPEDS